MFPNKVLCKFLNVNKDRVSNPMSQKSRSLNSPNYKPTYANCGKKHRGGCLLGREVYLGV